MSDATPKRVNGRLVCLPEHPYTWQSAGLHWVHPRAIREGGPDPCVDYFRCPVCGLRFECEVAE